MEQQLNRQLYDVFDKLSDLQKRQVLDFASHFLNDDSHYDKWEDKGFVAEMESRYQYYKSGGEMVSAEEVNRQVRELFKNAIIK